jgi:hypothetical protein
MEVYHMGIVDAFVNFANGFGLSKSRMANTRFGGGVVLDVESLSLMYRFDWVCRRIVEVIAEDATRKWIDFRAADKDIEYRMSQRIDDLFFRSKFEEAIRLARLYGGSLMILGAQDGRDPSEELDENNIRSLSFFNVVDRHEAEIVDYYKDPLSPMYMKPETYRINPVSGGKSGRKVHASRVIRFDGEYLPGRIKIQNRGWHDSTLQPCYEELKRYGTAAQSGAELFQDFVLRVFKMEGLADILNAGNEEAAKRRARAALSQFSLNGMALIDKEEDLAKIGTPITGLAEMLDKYIEIMSAASGIPRARLFGQQLGTLSGAGETTREYYDGVSSFQEKSLGSKMERCLKLVLLASDGPTGGVEPEGWSFEWRSLWQETEKEQVEKRALQAQTDQSYIQSGVLDAAEVRASRFRPDGYSIETVLLPGIADEDRLIAESNDPDNANADE